jgi:hypothetical protein
MQIGLLPMSCEPSVCAPAAFLYIHKAKTELVLCIRHHQRDRKSGLSVGYSTVQWPPVYTDICLSTQLIQSSCMGFGTRILKRSSQKHVREYCSRACRPHTCSMLLSWYRSTNSQINVKHMTVEITARLSMQSPNMVHVAQPTMTVF